jgi:hypothetical protein
MKNLKAFLLLLVSAIPMISLAHPGHGETGGYTITHYMVEPVHVVISVVALSVIVFLVARLRRSKQHS